MVPEDGRCHHESGDDSLGHEVGLIVGLAAAWNASMAVSSKALILVQCPRSAVVFAESHSCACALSNSAVLGCPDNTRNPVEAVGGALDGIAKRDARIGQSLDIQDAWPDS